MPRIILIFIVLLLYGKSYCQTFSFNGIVPTLCPEEATSSHEQFGETIVQNDSFIAVASPYKIIYKDGKPSYTQGAVYIYKIQEYSAPKFFQKITPPGTQNFSDFGHSLLITEDLLFIGAPSTDFYTPQGVITNGGRVYIYELRNNSWEQREFIDPPIVHKYTQFGSALAFQNDSLAIGASEYAYGETIATDSIPKAGAVFIYETKSQSKLCYTLTYEGREDGSVAELGFSLAFDGTDLLVSAPGGYFGTGENKTSSAGAVLVYHKVDGSYELSQILRPKVYRSNSRFGHTFSVSGSFLAVSTSRSSTFPSVFKKNYLGLWEHYQSLEAPNYIISNFSHCQAVFSDSLLHIIYPYSDNNLFTYQHIDNEWVKMGIRYRTDYNISKMNVYHSSILFGMRTYSDSNYNNIGAFSTAELAHCQTHYDTLIVDGVCYKYEAPSGGKFYEEAGNYTDTIYNEQLCPVLVHIELKNVYQRIQTYRKDTACYEFISPGNQTRLTESGTIREYLTSVHGCDSNVFYEVTIINNDANIVKDFEGLLFLDPPQTPYSIQWYECTDGLELLEGETSDRFNPIETGAYSFILTRRTCVDTSNCIFYEKPTEELVFFDSVWVHPNPFNSELTLHFPEDFRNHKIDVQLFDAQGRLIFQDYRLARKRNEFDFELSPGPYILVVRSGTKVKRFRILSH